MLCYVARLGVLAEAGADGRFVQAPGLVQALGRGRRRLGGGRGGREVCGGEALGRKSCGRGWRLRRCGQGERREGGGDAAAVGGAGAVAWAAAMAEAGRRSLGRRVAACCRTCRTGRRSGGRRASRGHRSMGAHHMTREWGVWRRSGGLPCEWREAVRRRREAPVEAGLGAKLGGREGGAREGRREMGRDGWGGAEGRGAIGVTCGSR